MPFRSEAQRRFMWAKHPEIAHRWAHEPNTATEKKRDLPYHVEKKAEWGSFVDSFLKQADVDIQARFGRLKDELEAHGVYSGTGHKRLVVPKSKLTEQDIGSLGFVPVTIAIPEAGQSRLRSFRHPNNNYHIHEHGENWTMHRDEHPASTMLIKKLFMEKKAPPASGAAAAVHSTRLGRTAAALGTAAKATGEFVRGIPHVVTEGVPGAYYYAKGQIMRTPDMAERVTAELPKEYFNRVSKWVPRPQIADAQKVAGLPQEEPAPRTRVPGLKQPRIGTPRLNPEVGSKIPSNPFRGNWQKLAYDLSHHEQMALGLAALGAGAYTLKRTGEELRNPRPSGVGAGAGARTVQRVLLPGTSRAQVAPQIYGSY